MQHSSAVCEHSVEEMIEGQQKKGKCVFFSSARQI